MKQVPQNSGFRLVEMRGIEPEGSLDAFAMIYAFFVIVLNREMWYNRNVG